MYVIPNLKGAAGAERSLAALAPHWVEALDMNIVTLRSDTPLTQKLREMGVRVTPIEATGRGDAFNSIRRLVRKDRTQLVHTTLWECDVIGRAAAASTGTPTSTSLVNTSYGPEMLSSPNLRPWKLRGAQAVDLLTARSSVRFHALTGAVASTMSRRIAVPAKRIDVIPRGRDAAQLGEWSPSRRDAARRELGVDLDARLVIAAARHEWQKGLDVLVKAAAELVGRHPDLCFLIGGRDGTVTDDLRQLVAELGLENNVRFIGNREDLAEVMCAADVFCVPSRWEGFAGILAELMALGVPTVASDIPPIREVSGPDPWLQRVRPDDPQALAAGIEAVLDDPGWRAKWAPVARQRFLDHFQSESAAAAMVEFFARSVAESRWPDRRSGSSS